MTTPTSDADPADPAEGLPISDYFLGLPFWGLSEWVGSFYPRGARAGDFLQHYASSFNSVEGNTTFYSLPSEATVAKWRQATPESFKFCFKLPKIITHDKALMGAEEDAAVFFERVSFLSPRHGSFLIQLPPSFGPERLPVLDDFLAALPRLAPAHRFAVELRQSVFYQGALAAEVDALLASHGCDRCLIDTRPLRDGDGSHPDIADARHRKPNLPIEPVAIGKHPMLRLIGHPNFETSAPWLKLWAEIVAGWIEEGRTPYCFIHLPDNRRAPELARLFHEELRLQLPRLGAMPRFPADLQPSQLSLF